MIHVLGMRLAQGMRWKHQGGKLQQIISNWVIRWSYQQLVMKHTVYHMCRAYSKQHRL
jgi:hypothetical protein